MIKDRKYVKAAKMVFEAMSALLEIGRVLVYDDAIPSIENNMGGMKVVTNETTANIPRAEATPVSKLFRDSASTIASTAGRKKRLAKDGDLDAILTSFRIIPNTGGRG